ELRAFLASLDAEPGRLEQVESELDALADLRRRFRVASLPELVERGEEARRELALLEDGHDPAAAAAAELEAAERELARVQAALTAARTSAAQPLADAVAAELDG